MFDFPILITLMVTIVIGYLGMYITLKNQIDDLKISSTTEKNNKLQIHNRKKIQKALNIIIVIMILTVLILFYLPSITSIVNDGFKSFQISDILNSFLKFLPFKEGFFNNPNFKFSYITGIILSVCILILWLHFFRYDFNFLSIIISLLILIFGLIWINYNFSLFLTNCIIHSFVLLSIILNILAYVIISLIVFFIFLMIILILPSSKTSETNNTSKTSETNNTLKTNTK